MLLRLIVALCLLAAPCAVRAQVQIAVIGDSQVRGKGVPETDAYPAKLERALKAKGYSVVVSNAGSNGDTTAGVLNRLDQAAPAGTKIAILSIGQNDLIIWKVERSAVVKNINTIVGRLKARGIEALVFGLGAKSSKLGTPVPGERASMEAAGAVFMPTMQADISEDPKLHVEASWRTGTEWHLNAAGYDIVVERTLPIVEQVLAKVK